MRLSGYIYYKDFSPFVVQEYTVVEDTFVPYLVPRAAEGGGGLVTSAWCSGTTPPAVFGVICCCWLVLITQPRCFACTDP